MNAITIEITEADVLRTVAVDGSHDEPPPITIGEAVVRTAANMLAAQYDLRSAFQGACNKLAAEKVSDEIDRQVAPIVTEALSVPFSKRNLYGEVTGGTQTMREVIVQRVEAACLIRPEGRRGTFESDRTPVENFVKKTVNDVVLREMKDAMDASKAEILKMLKANATSVITEAIDRTLQATR